MNEDLTAALDQLLFYLDRRYSPAKRRTLTERDWALAFEEDKKEFRRLAERVFEALPTTEPNAD